MNFTRQDIQKLSEGLAKYAKKDSDFKPLTSVDVGTDIAVLHEGSNKRVSFETLLDFVAKKIDLSKVPISFVGYAETTLSDVVLKMLSAIQNGNVIFIGSADNIPYGNDHIGSGVNVGPALNKLFDIIYGNDPFPTAAAEGDINELFTN